MLTAAHLRGRKVREDKAEGRKEMLGESKNEVVLVILGVFGKEGGGGEPLNKKNYQSKGKRIESGGEGNGFWRVELGRSAEPR